MHDTQFGHTDL